MAAHLGTLAEKIAWTEEPDGLQSMGSLRVGHDWETLLSRIGEGNGNPLQGSCLENPREGGAWWAAVCGVTQSRTRLKRLSSSSRRYIRKTAPKNVLNYLIFLTKKRSIWVKKKKEFWKEERKEKKMNDFSKMFTVSSDCIITQGTNVIDHLLTMGVGHISWPFSSFLY